MVAAVSLHLLSRFSARRLCLLLLVSVFVVAAQAAVAKAKKAEKAAREEGTRNEYVLTSPSFTLAVHDA